MCNEYFFFWIFFCWWYILIYNSCEDFCYVLYIISGEIVVFKVVFYYFENIDNKVVYFIEIVWIDLIGFFFFWMMIRIVFNVFDIVLVYFLRVGKFEFVIKFFVFLMILLINWFDVVVYLWFWNIFVMFVVKLFILILFRVFDDSFLVVFCRILRFMLEFFNLLFMFVWLSFFMSSLISWLKDFSVVIL